MARRTRKSRNTAFAFDAITVEGALIAPAMLAQIAALRVPADQKAADYGVPKGLEIRDEIARYFRIGQALFKEFAAAKEPSQRGTTDFVLGLLRDVFGFSDITSTEPKLLGDRLYPITLEALDGRVPVVVVPPADQLERSSDVLSRDGRRRSAASCLQDWLNVEDAALWGLAANGDRLRLMRDNASLTRPAYIEADLRHIFGDEAFSDFTAFWLLIHATRFGKPGTPATDCVLERWRDAGTKEGEAARDRLRTGVEDAILAFGNGFLSHTDNGALRERLGNGSLSRTALFEQLLQLIYRLIFLFAAEDRDLLHLPTAPLTVRALYSEGYSLGRLRDRAARRRYRDSYHDLWEGLLIMFAALARGEPQLGLPALGGLFAPGTLPDLEVAKLSNRDLLQALYALAWLKGDGAPLPVNWRDMQTEELGSVYESLLELTPQIVNDCRTFQFAEGGETKGNARKTSGSYYTPDSLVQTLLDGALDPVLERVMAEADDPAKALLSVTVIDPACGSGHFLLAAARRIATRLAKLRAGGLAGAEDFRHALRDVVRACIYGVDRNPMAVELAKVALWVETVDPGKPLGFLDANIRCGDALFGIFDLKTLEIGIPDAAYKALAGDDKATAKYFGKRNKDERDGQGTLDFTGGASKLPSAKPLADAACAIRALPEDSTEEIAAKRKRFEAGRADPKSWNIRIACDLYTAAFLSPKTGGEPTNRNAGAVPTTAHVWDALAARSVYGPLVGHAQELSGAARAFHWPLEFPDVMAGGGFDAVLGNPPWDKLTLFEREHFSAFPEVATESNAARRSKILNELFSTRPELERDWLLAQHRMDAMGEFMRSSGRYPATAVGDLNLYPLFAELAFQLRKKTGFAGLILKSLMFTGSTWATFTDLLVTSGALLSTYDFKNWEGLFPGVGYHERFSAVCIGPQQRQEKLRLAVGLTQPTQLYEKGRVLQVDRAFPRSVNPDTGTLPQCESSEDLRLLAKVSESYPTLSSSDWHARYTRGLDMTTDAAELYERERLESEGYSLEGNWFKKGQKSFAPMYEGKLIHQYDHRFATFDGIPAAKRFGVKAATNKPNSADLNNRDFESIPRYWVSDDFARQSAKQRRISEEWNIGFRHTSNVISNFRTAVGCVIGPAAFNYQCPNVVIDNGDPRSSALFLAIFNSTPYDYFLRLKFYGANLTKSLLMQSFVVPREEIGKYEDELVAAVCSLTNGSLSVGKFAEHAGHKNAPFAIGSDRDKLRARIDAIMFTLFGMDAGEAAYVFSTFPIWRDKQMEEAGTFVARDLAIEGLLSLE